MASHRIVAAHSDHGKHRPEDHPHAPKIPTGDTPMPPRHSAQPQHRADGRHADDGGGILRALGCSLAAAVPAAAITIAMHLGLWCALLAVLVLGLHLDAATTAGALAGMVAVGLPGGRTPIHAEPHPLAGQTVTLQPAGHATDFAAGDPYRVEDWWDRVSGGSWMFAEGNPAALKYAMRSAMADIPISDEVVYGKDRNGLGHIVHVSELVTPEVQA